MNVRFHLLAQEEYQRATLYYATQGRGLGRDFFSRVEQTLASIRRFPRSRRALDTSGVRQALLRQFPYMLVYVDEVDSTGNHSIVIYAVAHTKRKPGYWRDRLSSE